MMSNTTHNYPVCPIEDLGDGTYYYNFDVVATEIHPEDGGEPYMSYDYKQVRCSYADGKLPVLKDIQAALKVSNFSHKVKL